MENCHASKNRISATSQRWTRARPLTKFLPEDAAVDKTEERSWWDIAMDARASLNIGLRTNSAHSRKLNLRVAARQIEVALAMLEGR